MAWRVARSLDTLLKQLNDKAPRRSKASDGSIGDAAHASRDSDHNPWYGPGIVTARDFTHDPAGGLDGHWLATTLAASRDRRIKYIIWHRRILDSRPGNHPWRWMPYHGSNAHTQHVHVSVMPNASADDTRAWNLGGTAKPEAPDMTPDQARKLNDVHRWLFGDWRSRDPDSDYTGPIAEYLLPTAWKVNELIKKVDALKREVTPDPKWPAKPGSNANAVATTWAKVIEIEQQLGALRTELEGRK